MIYATVTQRLSDFFPRNLPREEQVYRNYTLPQQFWPYYTDPSLGTIKYNTYVGNIVSTETYDVRVKGGYFNYIDSLDRVYNEDGTYRYNVVIGYNQLTSVNGNSNIYIGRNSSSFSLNTNNTISLGQDIFPENDYIILRPNASRGTIKILPSKSSNQIYFCDYYGNNNILHDTFNETIRNSNFNINQFKNFIENSSFVVKTSYFGLTSSDIVYDDSSLYSKNSSEYLKDSNVKIASTNQNLSSCNITLTGNNIYSKSLSANLTDNVFRIDTSNFNISSCNINGDTSTITIKDNSRLTIDNSRISTTNQTFSLGYSALSDRNGMYSYAFGGFSENGDSQKSNFEFRGNTTSNSFVELFVNSSNDVMVIPTNKFWSGTINILGIRTNGENCARYMRQVTIGNVGGNVQLYGPSPSNTVTTIGTDVNARKTIGLTTYNTELEVTANNANNSLRIRVSGLPSENMRWMAFAEGIELKF